MNSGRYNNFLDNATQWCNIKTIEKTSHVRIEEPVTGKHVRLVHDCRPTGMVLS